MNVFRSPWSLRIAIATMALTSVGCDQASKALARERLMAHPPLHYLSGMLRLQYAENAGAFLSLGSGLPQAARYGLFTLGTAVALVALVIFVGSRRELDAAAAVGVALLIGGAVGNLIDRFRFDGVVVDFMNVGVGRLRTGIFNFADVSIVVGIAVLLWASTVGDSRTSSGAGTTGTAQGTTTETTT